MKNFIFFVLVLSILLFTFASPVVSDFTVQIKDLHYYVDEGNKLSNEEILNAEFRHLKDSKYRVPISNSNVWLKLEIPEIAKKWNEHLVLFSGSTEMILSMQLYHANTDRLNFIGECEVRLSSDTCSLSNLQYAFPLPANTNDNLFLKLRTGGIGVPNDFHIMAKNYYNQVNIFLILFTGLSCGAFLLMALLNFTLLATSNYKDLIYFSGFCTFGFLTIFANRGAWDAFLPRAWPTALNVYFIFLFTAFAFEIMFIKSFFKIKSNHKDLNLLFNIFIAFLIFLAVVNIYEPARDLIWNSIPILSLIYPLFSFSMLLCLVYRKETGAKSFFAAWFPELLGLVLLSLFRFGILEGQWAYGYAPLALRPLQLFLFSLIVFERLKKVNSEIEIARNKEQQGNVVKTLLRTLSHDLSNTSGIISLNTDLALRENPSPQVQNFLERIKRAVKSQVEMIQNAKTTYLKRGSNQAISLRPTDLRECLYAAIDAVEHKAFLKQVQINFKEPNEVFLVRADRTSLTHQVFVNLLDNAIKFTPSQKAIGLSVSQSNDDRYIVVSIQDEGIGLSENLISKIFEEAPEISRPGTENEEGSGLGLLVVRDFVAAFGGRIEVSSVPKQGTCFKIHLQLFGS